MVNFSFCVVFSTTMKMTRKKRHPACDHLLQQPQATHTASVQLARPSVLSSRRLRKANPGSFPGEPPAVAGRGRARGSQLCAIDCHDRKRIRTTRAGISAPFRRAKHCTTHLTSSHQHPCKAASTMTPNFPTKKQRLREVG